MQPVSFHPDEITFKAPVGESDNIADLPVLRAVSGDYRVLISCWRPTGEELKKIMQGEPIVITIVGETFPPIAVDAGLDWTGIKHPHAD